jgi:hypothetical protein
MNRRQRNSNRLNARKLKIAASLKNPKQYRSICMNCGELGPHFIPPCFGDPGFYACEKKK